MNEIFVVIDGNSLINRAYYAIQKPMITKEGIYTQGIYAFLSMLSKIRTDYKPTHMLVAFDRKAPTFRHLEYKEYKAGRKGMPIELAMEMPILKDILDAMGIERFEIDGFEADDILGTATAIAEECGVHSYIITGDRDALQLATDLTSVIINKRGMSEFKLYDDAAMMEEYGFDHIQFIDYKALRGDTSDNIPGIPGVGEKTATALIKQFGSLENIISHSDDISNIKLRQKVEDNAMQAMMSKRLATIIRTVPMDKQFDDFLIKDQDTAKLIELYTKLEFKTYLSRLLETSGPSEQINAASEEYNIPEIVHTDDISLIKNIISSEESIGIFADSDFSHIRKPSLNFVSVFDGKTVYVLDDAAEECLKLLNGISLNIYGHKLGEIYYLLQSRDINIENINTVFDSSVAYYVLNSSAKDPQLSDIIVQYFHVNAPKDEQISLISSENFDNAAFYLYFIKKLYTLQTKEIEDAGLSNVYYNIELPLIKVLSSMEYEGIKLDASELKSFGAELKNHILLLEKEIIQLAGEPFNINSPQQLSHILFEKLGLPAGKKTSKGYSTSAEILEKLALDFPIVEKILDYRTYAKLNSTYVEGLLPLQSNDGKVHAHFMQTITSTGRISCTEPNLQNIPIKTELGRRLRKSFTASGEDRVLIGADYSQIELRVLASMSGDNTLINAFNEGRDIHKETASKVFNVPLEEVTSIQRSNAKAVNFGVIYGMSSFGLSSELTISRKQAESYINDYFNTFKDVKVFLDKCIADCKKSGESRTLYGRRRFVPEINASQYMVRQLGERLAMNTPIQGTAADIIKIAMINVYNRLSAEASDAKLILQIHDELIIDAPKQKQELVLNILEDSMTSAAEMAVKLSVSKSAAYNWYDLK